VQIFLRADPRPQTEFDRALIRSPASGLPDLRRVADRECARAGAGAHGVGLFVQPFRHCRIALAGYRDPKRFGAEPRARIVPGASAAPTGLPPPAPNGYGEAARNDRSPRGRP